MINKKPRFLANHGIATYTSAYKDERWPVYKGGTIFYWS